MHISTSFVLTCSLLVGVVHCGGASDAVPEAAATSSPTTPAPSGSATAEAPAAIDAGTVAPTTTADASTSSGTCEAMTNDATPITAVDMIASAAPAPTGGTIQDGTYHLTGLTLFVGTTGTAGQIPLTLAGTARVQGNVVDQALDGTGFDGKAISERTRETIATTGTSVTYTMTCPASKTRSGTYSATSTSMTLFLVNDLGQTVGYTYTR